jgi:hypothetical protein
VIVHEPTEDWALPEDHELYDYITMARLRQNMETPLDERIEYATWSETVAYLSTASMDARYATRQIEELYRYSFRQYLDQWTPLEPGDQQPRYVRILTSMTTGRINWTHSASGSRKTATSISSRTSTTTSTSTVSPSHSGSPTTNNKPPKTISTATVKAPSMTFMMSKEVLV